MSPKPHAGVLVLLIPCALVLPLSRCGAPEETLISSRVPAFADSAHALSPLLLDTDQAAHVAHAIEDGRAHIPSSGWLAHRSVAALFEADRENVEHGAAKAAPEQKPFSMRRSLSALEAMPTATQRGLRLARASVRLLTGEYVPELDPLRPDKFDTAVVEAMLNVSLRVGAYLPDERAAARRALLRVAGLDPESFASRLDLTGQVGSEQEQLGLEALLYTVRCALYEVALVQCTLAEGGPSLLLDRAQGLALIGLHSYTGEGWSLTSVLSVLAIQAYDRQQDGTHGVRFVATEEATAAYVSAADARRALLSHVLRPEQLLRLYDSAGWDSEKWWRGRDFQSFPLYPEEWPTTRLPKVLRRPHRSNEAIMATSVPAAW